jgi:hypothetical protein
VVLDEICHAYETDVGGRQQQRADRCIECAIGDIEQTFGFCNRGETVVEPSELIGTSVEAASEGLGHIGFSVHCDSLRMRRPGRCAEDLKCRQRRRGGPQRCCRR